MLTWASSMTHFCVEIKTYEPSNLDMSRVTLDLLGRGRHKTSADEIVSIVHTSHIAIKRDQMGDRLLEGIRSLISQFMRDGR